MIVDAFSLQRQECKTNNAHIITGKMNGFISCAAILYKGIQTDDDELRELTEQEAGLMDIVININSISHIAQEEDKCSIVLNNGSLIFVNDELDSIINKIRKANALVTFQ